MRCLGSVKLPPFYWYPLVLLLNLASPLSQVCHPHQGQQRRASGRVTLSRACALHSESVSLGPWMLCTLDSDSDSSDGLLFESRVQHPSCWVQVRIIGLKDAHSSSFTEEESGSRDGEVPQLTGRTGSKTAISRLLAQRSWCCVWARYVNGCELSQTCGKVCHHTVSIYVFSILLKKQNIYSKVWPSLPPQR